jgi:tetratricopeptide (TPR) repeat protein
MSRDPDQFDFFVSYARKDNAGGWITRFIEELLSEHRKFTGNEFSRALKPFFDKQDILSFDDWQHRIHDALSKSRLFLAFISPSYFASEWCRREWKAWIDTEIAKHILSAGAAPIYFIEVPGFVGKVPGLAEQATLSEQQVAAKIAELCGLPKPYDIFAASVSPVVRQMRDRRQITSDFVKPFRDEGLDALRRADLHAVLERLAHDLDQRVQDVKRAAESETTVPPYNKRFSGRLDELLALRDRLKDDRAGVISGVHGLGGIGKTELAFTYAHAFASAYPGGRFLVPCEGKSSLRDSVLHLVDFFCDRISDENRKKPESCFAAIIASLRDRLDRLGHILLVLDNINTPALLTAQQSDCLTALGPKLHLLATTRLPSPAGARGNWLTLGELPDADALDLLEKHRAFASDAERDAAQHIVKWLGGFALALELVAAWLAAHEQSSSYAKLADVMGLEELEEIADEEDVQLRRHNHERRLTAVLGPVLVGLKPAERRAMEYSALLPPDCVPLPWLESLVTQDFPELARPGRLAEPWTELVEHLMRLAVFSRVESETTEPRLVRVHRMLQQVLKRDAGPRVESLHLRLTEHALSRCLFLREGWLKWENRWEIEPLYALADIMLCGDDEFSPLLADEVATRLFDLGNYPTAESLWRRVLATRERVLGLEHAETLTSLSNLAVCLWRQGNLTEAEPLQRRALAKRESVLGLEHSHTLASVNNLAVLLKEQGSFAEAESLYRRALDAEERLLGPEHPQTLMTISNLAALLSLQGRYSDAEPLCRRALEARERLLGPEHPHTLISMNELAVLLDNQGNYAESEQLHRRALATKERVLGPEHSSTLVSMSAFACLLNHQGNHTEAVAMGRRTLAAQERLLGPDHSQTLMSMNQLADFLDCQGSHAESEQLQRRAMETKERVLGPKHPSTLDSMKNLADLMEKVGKTRESLSLRAQLILRTHIHEL